MEKKSKRNIRRMIWFLVWIFSVVVISNYGGAISYGLFYAVTFFPLVSFIYLLFVFCFFRIYQKLEYREVIAGESTKYSFLLKNEGFFPFTSVSVRLYSFFAYVENMREDVEYELLRGDEYAFETNLVCKYRGEYYVGIKEIIITDFLSLFCLKYRIKSNVSAIVKPPVATLDYIESVEHVLGILQKEQAWMNTEQDVVVRDYINGDSLKQISWKLSAKENKLKVRQETGEQKQGIILLGDTKRYSRLEKEFLPLENKMLEVMGSLGLYLAKNHIAYTSVMQQSDLLIQRVEHIGQYQDYYNGLCKIRFMETVHFLDAFHQLICQDILQQNKIIFAVFHELEAEIITMAQELSNRGMVVVLYVVTEKDYSEYMQFANERIKIVILPIEAKLEGRL